MTLPLFALPFALVGCVDSSLNGHCDTTPVEVSDTEDPGLGLTPTDILNSIADGTMDVTVSAASNAIGGFEPLPADLSDTFPADFSATRAGGSAVYSPASDATCDQAVEELSVPVAFSFDSVVASFNLEAEGSMRAFVGDDLTLAIWAALESSDFPPDWQDWISTAEAGAVSEGCTVLAPSLTGGTVDAPSFRYDIEVECPNMMAAIGSVSVSWRAPE